MSTCEAQAACWGHRARGAGCLLGAQGGGQAVFIAGALSQNSPFWSQMLRVAAICL